MCSESYNIYCKYDKNAAAICKNYTHAVYNQGQASFSKANGHESVQETLFADTMHYSNEWPEDLGILCRAPQDFIKYSTDT